MQWLCSCVALILVPNWLQSPSFLLSWMCAVALSSPRVFNCPLELENSVKIFFALLPFSVVIGVASPFTILTNTCLAPLIGLVLFPASLLCFAFPGATLLVDPLWQMLIRFLNELPIPPPEVATLVPISCLWLVPAGLHSLLLFLEVQWNREKFF